MNYERVLTSGRFNYRKAIIAVRIIFIIMSVWLVSIFFRVRIMLSMIGDSRIIIYFYVMIIISIAVWIGLAIYYDELSRYNRQNRKKVFIVREYSLVFGTIKKSNTILTNTIYGLIPQGTSSILIDTVNGKIQVDELVNRDEVYNALVYSINQQAYYNSENTSNN